MYVNTNTCPTKIWICWISIFDRLEHCPSVALSCSHLFGDGYWDMEDDCLYWRAHENKLWVWNFLVLTWPTIQKQLFIRVEPTNNDKSGYQHPARRRAFPVVLALAAPWNQHLSPTSSQGSNGHWTRTHIWAAFISFWSSIRTFSCCPWAGLQPGVAQSLQNSRLSKHR